MPETKPSMRVPPLKVCNSFNISSYFILRIFFLRWSTLSSKGRVNELTWLRSERVRQASRIKELVSEIIEMYNKWNSREENHNKLLRKYGELLDQVFGLQNSLSSARSSSRVRWSGRVNLFFEARDEASRLEARATDLEVELCKVRSSHDPEGLGGVYTTSRS